MPTVYTFGHSTRPLESFLQVLSVHKIQVLADIRAFPMSRRMPHFNREFLERELAADGIDYQWKKDLGGRRGRSLDNSPNRGLRVEAFRNYADYMLTPAFQDAMNEVLVLASERATTIMCAEAVYFRCHRMLVSDWLTAHGHEVLHIIDAKKPKPHRLTPEARFSDGQLLYPGDLLF